MLSTHQLFKHQHIRLWNWLKIEKTATYSALIRIVGWQNEACNVKYFTFKGNDTWNVSSPSKIYTWHECMHLKMTLIPFYQFQPGTDTYQYKVTLAMPKFNVKMIMNIRFLMSSACALSWWATYTHTHIL